MNENISQRRLSELTGIAQSTIARIEKNVHIASLSTFIKILDALDYHIEIVKNILNNDSNYAIIILLKEDVLWEHI